VTDDPMVERLAELEAGTTPAPWATEHDGIYHADRLRMVTPIGDSDQDRADAALIVAMRNDLPALLSQLREQRDRADRAEALVRAKQSWIDGMKVDYDDLNDEAHDHAHSAAIAEARAERAEGVVQAAKSVERASHVSERAITNAMAGLRVRLDAYDREDR